MTWDYNFTSKARKELKKLGHEPSRKIIEFLDERVAGDENPRRFGKSLKGDLGDLGDYWRYRVENYRILCEIKDGLCVVLVVKLGHRSDVYD